MYLHVNEQITPFFLNSRSQFFLDKIFHARPRCRLRYSSEAFFCRVMRNAALKDRVLRSFFHHFSVMNDWSLGLANFCQPF